MGQEKARATRETTKLTLRTMDRTAKLAATLLFPTRFNSM